MMIIVRFDWRGGRVVECARLESVWAGNRPQGSNPCLSAIKKVGSEVPCVRPNAGLIDI